MSELVSFLIQLWQRPPRNPEEQILFLSFIYSQGICNYVQAMSLKLLLVSR